MKPLRYTQPVISLLYVEDDPIIREVLRQLVSIKFPDLQLIIAENGKIGLELFKEHQPQLVITDIMMPDMDGIRMAEEIKALDSETIIIVCSAYNDANALLKAIEFGVNHYLLKPIDYRKLFALIEKHIDGIMLEGRLQEQNAHIRKLSLAIEQSPNMVVITDDGGVIEYVNARFTEITGYAQDEIVGRTPWAVDPAGGICHALAGAIAAGQEWRGEQLSRKKNGEMYWETASIFPLSTHEAGITHFVAVKEDVTPRKKAEEEIKALNNHLTERARELEGANQELETFTHTVTHDLRVPLTAISGFSQVLLESCTDWPNEDCLGYVQYIQKSAERMNQIISTLLDFSRLAYCGLACKPVNLSNLARMAADALRVAEPERRVTFDIAEEVIANGDERLLQVVMENLIGNAWKYTGKRQESVIEFGVVEVDGTTTCFVRDNGAGFDMAGAAKLFTPFQRLHNQKDFGGHGIGLATVRRIIQRHGGQIWAEGEVDKGAVFYFVLPQTN